MNTTIIFERDGFRIFANVLEYQKEEHIMAKFDNKMK